ncbi:hypothetical protein G0P99_11655 [Ruegeria sp. PrR005]|uniref:Thioredoxin family protein n=2 Tax=Ruegeria sp. PrR005 TaxID=2706882 RepID=A0A6B2NUN9_9RHOB|nr:hypothetical protein [Ruegeria sp. PrR005]NDW45615.1 hypothetical protein [Ruegeria sp. PrR005]
MNLLRNLIASVGVALIGSSLWAADLVMVEQPGCEWCAVWNKEIGEIYPLSAEGRFAPLKRVDLRAIPEDLDLNRKVIFTPTFLIVEDGREVGRIEGYPGEHFFWPVLEKLLIEKTDYRPPGPGSI